MVVVSQGWVDGDLGTVDRAVFGIRDGDLVRDLVAELDEFAADREVDGHLGGGVPGGDRDVGVSGLAGGVAGLVARGPLDAAGHDQLLAGVREAVYRRSHRLATQLLRIEPSRTGENAAAVGAGTLAIEHALSPRQVDREVAGGRG